MKTITLQVEGMVCTGCENRIQNALKTMEGVKEVTASHEKKLVMIETDEMVQEQTIKEKIEDIGFSVIKES